MKIPIELFLNWQEKNMYTYSNSNVPIEFYLLFYKNKLKQKVIICPHCKNRVIKTKGDKIYCSRECQMKAAQLRYKNKLK
jgi:hypothetical protein